jgi:hypothetical protein
VPGPLLLHRFSRAKVCPVSTHLLECFWLFHSSGWRICYDRYRRWLYSCYDGELLQLGKLFKLGELCKLGELFKFVHKEYSRLVNVRLRLWPTLWYRHLWRYALPLSVLLFCCCSCCRCAHALRCALGLFAPLLLFYSHTECERLCNAHTQHTHARTHTHTHTHNSRFLGYIPRD